MLILPNKHQSVNQSINQSLVNKTLGETQNLSNFNVIDYRATELYSSGEQNAAFSYIILRLT